MTPKDADDYSGVERRSETRATRPFELVRYFSIASAAAFVGAIALVATLQFWTSKSDLVRLAEIETVELGQTVSNSAWPAISRLMEGTGTLDDEALRSRPETRRISEILQRLTVGLPVLKIKIYDLDGRTLYSTDAKEIGQNKGDNPGFLSAARQREPASKMSHKGQITAFSGVLFNRDVVETYLPVYGPTGDVDAVFELYSDVSRTVGGIHGMMRQLVLSLLAAFALLYGILYLIVRRADRILHAQSIDIEFKSAALAAKNVDLEREVNERRQIEGRLQGAVQSLQEAFAFFDADDRLVFCNDEYRRMHPLGQELVKPGVKFEHLIRTNVERGNIADAIGREEEYIRERMTQHRNPKNPIVRRLTDGRSVIIYENRTPDGGICQTLTDVTDIRRAADAVRQSEGRLRGAVAAVQEGFAYYDADDRLVLFNNEYLRLHKSLADILKPGLRFEDMMRAAVERGTIADADGREEDQIRERLELHRNPKGPILRTLADGTCYVINESRTPDGGVVVTEIDVTERQKAERALKLSESRLRGAIESLQEGFALCDADDRVVAVNDVYASWNPHAREVVHKGGTFEDMLRANVADGAIADAIGREEEFVRDRMERHRNPKGPIMRRFSDGRWSLIRETKTPEGGTALTFTDVTELKRAEDALREGERALRAVIDSVPAMVSAKDRDFRYIFMNEYQARLYGTTPAEAVGKSASDLLGKVYGDYTQSIDAEVIGGNRGRFNYEEDWTDPTGRTRVLLTTKVPLTDEAGQANGVVTVALDITDRKRAEEALRESEQRLKTIIDSVPAVINVKDTESRYLLSNRFHRELLGMTEAELLGRSPALISAEHAKRVREMEKAVMASGEALPFYDDTLPDTAGVAHQFMLTKAPLKDLSGKTVGTVTAGIDVTHRRKLEQAVEAERRRLVDAIDSIEGGAILYDADDRVVLYNSTYRKHLGAIEHVLVPGARFEDVIRAVADAGIVDQAIADPEKYVRDRVARHRALAPSLLHMKNVDRWYLLREYRTSDGGTLIIRTDVTEQKRVEEALRASEERFKAIAESASDWYWEMGPELRFTFVSDRFHELTGFHPEDIVGKTLAEFVGADMAGEHREQWRAYEKSLKNREPVQNFEFVQRESDGLRQDVRVSGKPFFDADGAFLGYRGVATDITDYRRTERELAHHTRMESLGNLAGGIAHNLNNLLQPILILSDLTGHALPKSSVERQNLEFINQAGNRAKELVDRILAFSREHSYQFKSTDIYDVVREELKLIHSIVPSSITVNEKLDRKVGAVMVDVLQAQTVLMNIVANAIDAMEGKPGTLDISLVRARVGSSARNSVPTLRKGNYAKLTIGDSGHGMDQKTLNRIFDPFFTTKPPGKGTGLGLSTAFGIVAKHGGTIRAASTPGKGTTFDVYLPLDRSKGR